VVHEGNVGSNKLNLPAELLVTFKMLVTWKRTPWGDYYNRL